VHDFFSYSRAAEAKANMARIKRDPSDTPIAEKILDAAGRLFSRVGYEHTSMKSIAAEAEITPAALYYHYANKQDIVFQTLKRAVTGLADQSEAAVAGVEDPTAALRAFVTSHICYQLNNLDTVAPVYTALIYGMRHQPVLLSAEQLDELRIIERRHLDTLRMVLTRGAREGQFSENSATLVSFAIIGMCEHVSNWYNPARALSPEAVAAFFADQAELIARGGAPVRAQRPKRRGQPRAALH
jgi:AcrR family transcriptional regulator